MGPAVQPKAEFVQDPVAPVTRTVCISMVRNEQDIIEPFLRHNSRYFDAMIVLDNGSADRTRAIALETARELGSIFVTDLRQKAYDQGAIFTRASSFVQEAFFADFVMFLDADEFLMAPSPEQFRQELDKVAIGETALLPWRTYLPDPAAGPDDGEDVLKRITWRRTRERPLYGKIALRLGGRTDERFIIGQGAHWAQSSNGEPLRQHDLPEEIFIAHLPVRSRSQMLAKGVVGWRANLARAESARREAQQWQRLHDLYHDHAQGGSDFDLSHEALVYAQSKPHLTWDANARPEVPAIIGLRRHSDGTPDQPERLIASSETPGERHPARFTVAERVRVSQGGAGDIPNAFDADWHWSKLFLDIAPFANLFEMLNPQSVLDVGCGHGLYLDIARQCGAREVLGIDGVDRSGTVLGEDEYLRLDLQERHVLGRKFDLVLCLEVVEHIHPAATGMLFDFLAEHAAGPILFSMAEPGQPGHGHINCLGMDEVLDLWQDRGWWPDLNASLGFRSLATLSWFRRNVVLLRNQRRSTSEQESRALRQIAARPFRWYSQKPAVRFGTFEEAPPRPKFGYGSATK
jgi:SAM-dependent methyltransferase